MTALGPSLVEYVSYGVSLGFDHADVGAFSSTGRENW